MYGGLNKQMDAAAEIRRNLVSQHQIQPEYGDEQADGGTGLPNLSRETKFSGANGDREISIFPVQLTSCRIGNITRLIHTLAICDDHAYMPGTNYSEKGRCISDLFLSNRPRTGMATAYYTVFGCPLR